MPFWLITWIVYPEYYCIVEHPSRMTGPIKRAFYRTNQIIFSFLTPVAPPVVRAVAVSEVLDLVAADLVALLEGKFTLMMSQIIAVFLFSRLTSSVSPLLVEVILGYIHVLVLFRLWHD